MELTFEEKALYSIIIDLMYARGGKPIPNDPQWLARICGLKAQRVKRILSSINLRSKLQVSSKIVARLIEDQGSISAEINGLGADIDNKKRKYKPPYAPLTKGGKKNRKSNGNGKVSRHDQILEALEIRRRQREEEGG
jgi:uncharacterized protein YdaU (DUF1376 family)